MHRNAEGAENAEKVGESFPVIPSAFSASSAFLKLLGPATLYSKTTPYATQRICQGTASM